MYLAFERKHHQDGEEQRNERDRADSGNEFLLVPLASFGLETDEPGEHAGDKWNAQIDEDALGDLANGDIDDRSRQ